MSEKPTVRYEAQGDVVVVTIDRFEARNAVGHVTRRELADAFRRFDNDPAASVAILTGVLATADVNANLNTNLKEIVGKTLVFEQLKAVALTLVLSVVATAVIATVVKVLIGLRPTVEAETQGLDITDHQEEGYVL